MSIMTLLIPAFDFQYDGIRRRVHFEIGDVGRFHLLHPWCEERQLVVAGATVHGCTCRCFWRKVRKSSPDRVRKQWILYPVKLPVARRALTPSDFLTGTFLRTRFLSKQSEKIFRKQSSLIVSYTCVIILKKTTCSLLWSPSLQKRGSFREHRNTRA